MVGWGTPGWCTQPLSWWMERKLGSGRNGSVMRTGLGTCGDGVRGRVREERHGCAVVIYRLL